MRLRWLRLLLPAMAVAGLAVALSSCGGGGGGGGSSNVAAQAGIPSEFAAPTAAPDSAKKGGHATVLAASDIDYMDPGAAYYQFTYMFDLAWFTPLMGWQPDDTTQPTPLLATGEPQVSSDDKTLTFKINTDVHYSPPVNRAVKSADVKYAIERSLLPGVPNGYTSSYLGDLEGFQQAEQQVKQNKTVAPDISGIETPDDSTIVFHLTQPSSAPAIQALSLPVSSPVPEEYAKKYDAQSPSTYGEYAAFTGPYMVKNDPQTGKLTGYTPGKEIDIVRNPNWKEGQDWRPAYLDSITVQEGFSDPTSMSTKILDGTSELSGDTPPSPTVVQKLATTNQWAKSQLAVAPSGGNRYVALNMTKPPFGPGGGLSAEDALNIRKAVIANSDRTALRNTRGGALFGPVATHFIPPGIPGFEEAGGLKGPNLDFVQNPNGDPQLAASYMKKAGFSSGKCEGSICDVTMVGDDTPPGKDTATVFQHQLEQLGFNVTFQPVAHDIMYTKFCSVPSNQPNVCPNVGWIKDFNDPQSMLQITFNGEAINPSNNSNWPQLDDPKINKAIDDAVTVSDPQQRAQTWGKIDDMIMAQAPAVPWVWDNEPLVQSDNVAGVYNLFNAEWDLSYTSLK
jgi:peptide/nickel transport system substrate-binding protein